MFLALAVPASAGNHPTATGDVYWTNYNGSYTGIHTVLSLHQDAPGGTSQYGDRGSVYQYVPGKGEAWIEVMCVSIDGNEAHWAGKIVDATGGYTVGKWMEGWLKDGGTPGAGVDGIGSIVRSSSPCPNLVFEGRGTVTDGNLQVHPVTTP